ncbi:13659_t:CDS:2 [Entrophospora sp. SA101]|nr:13659_t:CDS:2 [Entrophospora sp. SA101]
MSGKHDDKMVTVNLDYDNKTNTSSSLEKGLETDRSFERKLLWKLDLLIIPLVTIAYLLGNIDRVNIGNAKIAGFVANTGIKESDFNNALSCFYIGYVLFDIPSNIMTKKIGINFWFPIIMIGWAICSLIQAFIVNAAELYVLRILIGIFESGLTPGFLFYLTLWYDPYELTVRVAFCFGMAMSAGAFGGIAAYGIEQMDGYAGLYGWQWIFIIEAFPTIIVALVFFFVPKNPESAKFLSKEEVSLIQKKLKSSSSSKKLSNELTKKQLISVFTDYKIYIYTLMMTLTVTISSSLLVFTPSIIRDLGFDALAAQALSTPPFIIGTMGIFFTAWSSNRNNERGLHIVGPGLVSIAGILGLIFVEPVKANITARYILFCIVITGALSYLPVLTGWFINNIAIAFIVGVGQIGGIIGGQVYRADDSPKFIRGHSILLAFSCLNIALALLMKFILHNINKKRNSISLTNESNFGSGIGKVDYSVESYDEELCDNHPSWRFET